MARPVDCKTKNSVFDYKWHICHYASEFVFCSIAIMLGFLLRIFSNYSAA